MSNKEVCIGKNCSLRNIYEHVPNNWRIKSQRFCTEQFMHAALPFHIYIPIYLAGLASPMAVYIDVGVEARPPAGHRVSLSLP